MCVCKNKKVGVWGVKGRCRCSRWSCPTTGVV